MRPTIATTDLFEVSPKVIAMWIAEAGDPELRLALIRLYGAARLEDAEMLVDAVDGLYELLVLRCGVGL